jgi:NAD(P)H-dependent FMN reductase
MFYVPVVLGSIRRNRESIKIARFAVRSLKERGTVDTELLDLKELNLPMMEERLRFRDDAGPNLLEFSAKVDKADKGLTHALVNSLLTFLHLRNEF